MDARLLPFTIYYFHLLNRSIYAKSKAKTFQGPSWQTPRTRCAAGATNYPLSELSGASHATSGVSEVWLLQGPPGCAGRTGLTHLNRNRLCEISRRLKPV